MSRYNWQLSDWPSFQFSTESVENELVEFSKKNGRTSGLLDGLSPEASATIVIGFMLDEALKTSAIEGEFPNRIEVLSSIRKNLGLSSEQAIRDKSADGLGELTVDVRNTFKDSLTAEKLFAWHKMLLRGNEKVLVGHWRTHEDAMQIISGALGKERIHYEAPPSSRVPEEMQHFLNWFNATAPGGVKEIRHAPVRAAIAHLYFETIHPFEDGNGRIGRSIAEKALSQTVGEPVVMSLSKTIEAGKKKYYAALQLAQRSNEITPWMKYFVQICLQAQSEAEQQISFILTKAKFFSRFRDQLNTRQLAAVQRMLEEGPSGFVGGMNARKYIGITKTSKATATRDLQELVEMGAFVLSGNAGGRSRSYVVNF